MNYLDAHNHLHSARLAPHRAAILEQLARLPIGRAVVNGTREDDWEAVASLACEQTFVLPSFGLHPWYVASRTACWLENLREKLVAHPAAGIGEIGLDRWIESHDLAAQTEVFLLQLALAAELNRPATIHCLRAWGALEELLRQHPLPARGFLLHAYSGPTEMVARFTALGGYFSFNAYFLHERKARQREVFRHIPANRLLVETDAPDMRPPDEFDTTPIRDADGNLLNHPVHIALAYEKLAEIRREPVETLAAQVAENFVRLFGGVRQSHFFQNDCFPKKRAKWRLLPLACLLLASCHRGPAERFVLVELERADGIHQGTPLQIAGVVAGEVKSMTLPEGHQLPVAKVILSPGAPTFTTADTFRIASPTLVLKQIRQIIDDAKKESAGQGGSGK